MHHRSAGLTVWYCRQYKCIIPLLIYMTFLYGFQYVFFLVYGFQVRVCLFVQIFFIFFYEFNVVIPW